MSKLIKLLIQVCSDYCMSMILPESLFFFLKGKKAVEGKTRKGKKSMHILMIPENPVLQGTKKPLWNEAKYKRLENIWLG